MPHASKREGNSTGARRRYRHYVGRGAGRGGQGTAMRLPAGELETAVAQPVAALFADGMGLIASAWLDVTPARMVEVAARCGEIAQRLSERGHGPLATLVEQVCVSDTGLEIACSTAAIAELLGVARATDAPATIMLACDVRLTRSGLAMRLVHDNGAAAAGGTPNAAAIRLIVKARRWWAQLRAGEVDITRLAEIERVSPAYLTRVVRLAFLSPQVTDAILTGKAAVHVDAALLVLTGAIVASWPAQARTLLPAS